MNRGFNPYSPPEDESVGACRCEPGTFGMVIAGYVGAIATSGCIHYYFNKSPTRFGSTMMATGAIALIGLLPFGVALLPLLRRSRTLARRSAIFAGALTPTISVLIVCVLEASKFPANWSQIGYMAAAGMIAVATGAIGGLLGAQLRYVFVRSEDANTEAAQFTDSARRRLRRLNSADEK